MWFYPREGRYAVLNTQYPIPNTVLYLPQGTLTRKRDPENSLDVHFFQGTRVPWISLFLGCCSQPGSNEVCTDTISGVEKAVQRRHSIFKQLFVLENRTRMKLAITCEADLHHIYPWMNECVDVQVLTQLLQGGCCGKPWHQQNLAYIKNELYLLLSVGADRDCWGLGSGPLALSGARFVRYSTW